MALRVTPPSNGLGIEGNKNPFHEVKVGGQLSIIVLVGDGMSDRRVSILGDRTPLQYSRNRNMCLISKLGENGIIDPISPGVTPGSDTAHIALLGYDPFEIYTGRGVLEALGSGISLKRGDIAFRCNFCTLDEKGVIVDRRAGRIREDGEILAKSLDGIRISGVKIKFKQALAHRCVLVLRGKKISHEVTDTDPKRVGVKPLIPKGRGEDGKRTAEILREFLNIAKETLSEHPVNKERIRKGLPPANFILLRGASFLPEVQKFKERFGVNGACIAGMSLVKGVARLLGLDVVEVEGATGGLDTDVLSKADATISSLDKYDFVLVNVKGTDEASHDGKVFEKVNMIEKIDLLLGRILEEKGIEELTIAVTADHTTPLEVKKHTGDPVPVAIYSKSARRDSARLFDEISCSSGSIGRISGKNLLPIMFNLEGIGEEFGE